MSLRTLSILLVILALGFAAAPSWIDAGASLNYTSGGSTTSFTVASRSSTDIKVLITTSSPQSKGTIVENASADSGHFWFDQSLLGTAYEGEIFGDYSVMNTSQLSYAGKTWNAVTLQGIVSGATTTQIYDADTGLLLEQKVDAVGVPKVVLSKYYIPAFAPPPPPANVTPPQNNTAPPPPVQNVTNSTQNTTPPVQNSTPPVQPSQPPSQNSTTPAQPTTPAKKPITACCGSAFILLLIGFVAISRRYA